MIVCCGHHLVSIIEPQDAVSIIRIVDVMHYQLFCTEKQIARVLHGYLFPIDLDFESRPKSDDGMKSRQVRFNLTRLSSGRMVLRLSFKVHKSIRSFRAWTCGGRRHRGGGYLMPRGSSGAFRAILFAVACVTI